MATDSVASKRRRILVLTSTFPRWEGDREPPFVFELSRRLAKHCEVSVLAPHSQGAAREEVVADIHVHRFRYFFSSWQTLAYNGGILANLKGNRAKYLLVPCFMLAEFVVLLRLLRKESFDVIHAHWLIPQGLIALGARIVSGRQPAIVCTSHGGDLFGLSGRILTKLKRWIINHADKVTVVSQAMRQYAHKISQRSDIEVISMGCDLKNRFTPDNTVRSDNEILFVGRLVEKKGVSFLIAAMRNVIATHPKTLLLIAGEGPERPNLEAQVARLGITAHIRFLGSIDNSRLQEYYRRATLFVAPSIVAKGGDQEGLGLVFVEAMGCECPVIASDLPAIADVVIDGATGLICRQKDSTDLAQKIELLLSDPDRRASLGREGRRHVIDKFDWEIVAGRYARLINDIIVR